MKAAAHKVSSSIKRTLSATDVIKSKHVRRISEETSKNGDLDKSVNSPKINFKEPDSSTDFAIPTKKIKTEVPAQNDSEDDKASECSDTETVKKASPIKYPFRYVTIL